MRPMEEDAAIPVAADEIRAEIDQAREATDRFRSKATELIEELRDREIQARNDAIVAEAAAEEARAQRPGGDRACEARSRRAPTAKAREAIKKAGEVAGEAERRSTALESSLADAAERVQRRSSAPPSCRRMRPPRSSERRTSSPSSRRPAKRAEARAAAGREGARRRRASAPRRRSSGSRRRLASAPRRRSRKPASGPRTAPRRRSSEPRRPRDGSATYAAA